VAFPISFSPVKPWEQEFRIIENESEDHRVGFLPEEGAGTQEFRGIPDITLSRNP
jgi:hypothetical protein